MLGREGEGRIGRRQGKGGRSPRAEGVLRRALRAALTIALSGLERCQSRHSAMLGARPNTLCEVVPNPVPEVDDSQVRRFRRFGLGRRGAGEGHSWSPSAWARRSARNWEKKSCIAVKVTSSTSKSVLA
jgi:hypothetical protein